jgi:hypothetical protein
MDWTFWARSAEVVRPNEVADRERWMVIEPAGGGRSSASAGALAPKRWAAAEASEDRGPLESPARPGSAIAEAQPREHAEPQAMIGPAS